MPSAVNESRLERLQHKGARVRQEMNGLTAEVEGALGDLERTIRVQLEERPYVTLAAASGLGYVLGGGMPVTLTRMALAFGGRVAFVMLAQRMREVMSEVGSELTNKGEE
jgi:hypothetical protein